MKLFVPAALTALFPYTLLAALHCLFTGFGMDTVFGDGIGLLLALGAAVLAAAVSAAVLCIQLRRDAPPRTAARIAMLIKLAHIPAYLALFALGLMFLLTVFTAGFTLFIVFWDCLAIAFSGAAGAVAVCRCHRGGVLTRTEWIAHTVLQFIFCADVVSAVIVSRKAALAQRSAER